MSIENALSSIARSLEIIAAHMQAPASAPAPVIPTNTPATAVVAPVAPVVPAEPVAIPMPAAPAVAMPPPPVFEIPTFTSAPVVPAVPTVVPFADQKSMVAWVVKTYGELGPQKGMGIQKVIQSLGHASINEVKPDQYAALYQGVEALK